MAPGAKKKNANKKSYDNVATNNKRSVKNSVIDEKANDSSLNEKDSEVEPENNYGKKYSKRTVTSNWEKYEETPSEPFADTLRGKDIEVLLSYTGGSGSHLQLRDEKDWEEATVDEKSIALDLNDLKHVVKSIPFYKQINLLPDVFTQEQLSKLKLSAENWKISYAPNLQVVSISENVKECQPQESLDSNLNIIQNYEPEDVQESVLSTNSVLIEEKTENIIESLASCLSLKGSLPERSIDIKPEVKKEAPNLNDDLDFLLSLNVSLKNPVKSETENKTNVDDWLNSILDD